MSESSGRTWIAGAAGLVVGGFVGYVYRPPAFLIGQLPFDVVVTRGATLKGLDQIHLSVARTSFNYLLVGALAGAVIGVIVGARMSGRGPK